MFVTVSEFREEIYVHRRKYEHDGEKAIPTKTGATLKPIRWKTVTSYLSEIERSVDALHTDENIQVQKHLGGNWYVTVTSGFYCVDFRQF